MNAISKWRQSAIVAIPFSPRWRRLGHHCALLGLLGALGVLAFILSAISPDDDDIQQECFQSNKSKQFVLANYKAPSDIRGFRISTLRSALPRRWQLLANSLLLALIFISHQEIDGTIFSSRTGDRSPPTKSS
jgi:hypothetical protein